MPEKRVPNYAASTSVDVQKTKAEIEKLLSRYHATAFVPGYANNQEFLVFEIEGRRVRFSFPLLTVVDAPETINRGAAGGVTARTDAQKQTWLEQKQRTRWRELLLLIKAKLVAVEAGITTVEEEFLPYVVMANNQTVHEWVSPQLRKIYGAGKIPALMPGVENKSGEEA